MPFPNEYRGISAADALDAIERAFTTQVARETVAAIVLEPVQGEAGFIVPPREFVQGVREICDREGIVLVADEVQTGYGRTGRMFAIEHFDVEPDLITVAKSIAAGLPLSGVLGKAAIMDAPGDNAVGGTYVGNPVAQAAALAVLDVFEDEGLVERAGRIGETIRSRMSAWQERHPQIGDVRGLGAMLAIELVRDPATKEPAPELALRVAEAALAAGPAAPAGRRPLELHPRPLPARDHRSGAGRGARRVGRGARRGSRVAVSAASAFYLRGPALSLFCCPHRAGEVIADRYELEELVGTGGMSSVYRAHDQLLERHVALKVLHPHYADDERVRRALPPGGPRGREALAPAHRHGDRPRRGRRPAVHRLRVRRRREPQAADRAHRAAADAAARSSSRSRSPTRSHSRTSTGSCTAT